MMTIEVKINRDTVAFVEVTNVKCVRSSYTLYTVHDKTKGVKLSQIECCSQTWKQLAINALQELGWGE